MTKQGVGLSPTVACEFKRAGFLEGEAIGTSLPIGLKLDGDWEQNLQCATRGGGSPVRV